MTTAPLEFETARAARRARHGKAVEWIRRHPTVAVGSALLITMVLMAIFAPYLGTIDPKAIAPIKRLKFPQADFWFGTDGFGRDVYSRVI